MNYRGTVPEKVFAGRFAAERLRFCQEFIAQKKAVLARIETDIRVQIQNRNEEVTCRKGCAVCCVLYIEANIQECEAIAFYLDQRRNLLAGFLQRYAGWRERMQNAGQSFYQSEILLHRDSRYGYSANDQVHLVETLKDYHKKNLPCPFLEDEACSIYEVRPYVCANHYVTSPAAWCRAENWFDPDYPDKPVIYMTEISELESRSFYLGLKKPVIGFMPTMVFRILTEGFDYIVESTG